MRLLGLGCAALASVVAACAGDASSESVGDERSPIIGTATADAERPMVLNLDVRKPDGLFTCTGTLIGRHTVVTARHCIAGSTDVTACDVTAWIDRVGVGTGLPGGERVRAMRCDVLDATAMIDAVDDLATVRLASDVDGVGVAALAAVTPRDATYEVYGYGSFGEGPTLGTKCEHVSDGHKRKATYRGRFTPRFAQSTCPGDSGGPHFLAGSAVLVGVTSAGFAAVAAYEINTEIAPHREWLVGRLVAYDDAPPLP